jgi:hypothetical protein
MTFPPLNLKTFIGYQINSHYHLPSDFKKMGQLLNQRLATQPHPIKLDIEFGEFPPGAKLWDEIVARIESSHITIFDISENNPTRGSQQREEGEDR